VYALFGVIVSMTCNDQILMGGSKIYFRTFYCSKLPVVAPVVHSHTRAMTKARLMYSVSVGNGISYDALVGQVKPKTKLKTNITSDCIFSVWDDNSVRRSQS